MRPSPRPLCGSVGVPGDKSISHRALILSAIAKGMRYITGFLFGTDNLSTAVALQKLGVSLELNSDTKSVCVRGVGLYGLRPSDAPLDMGNAGTAMRLFMGLLAGQPFSSTLVGDASLSKRPMLRVAEPLRRMGAVIRTTTQGTAPVSIQGGQRLKGIDYTLPVPSAQVYSALQLASLYAEGPTRLFVSGIIRDHTDRMLGTVALGDSRDRHFSIPGDLSSAAFFIVAASVIPGSHIVLHRVGVNPTRTGVLEILGLMGAHITLQNFCFYGEEPVADIHVRAAPLQGIDIPVEYVSSAIDEIPVLLVAAATAKGLTRLTGAGELRVKESDRLIAMQDGLMRLGIQCEPLVDGLLVEGGEIKGGVVDSYGDHRIAMAFAVAGCIARESVEITNCDHVETSFPHFVALATELGFSMDVFS